MTQKCVMASWLVGILSAQVAAQVTSGPGSQGAAQIKQVSLDQSKEALQRTVTALQNVGIEFTVKVDWATPNLPRVTGEKGYTYLNDGKMFYRFERTFPPLPGRPHVVELEEFSYDGHTFYVGKNSENSAPSIKTLLGDNPENPYGWQTFSKTCLYLEAAGYRLPVKVAQWKGGRLTSVVLDYLSEGQVNRAVIDKENDGLLVINVTIPDPVVFWAQKTDLDLLAAEMRQNKSDPAEIEKAIDEVKRRRSSGRVRLVQMRLDPEKKYAVVRRTESTNDGDLIYDIEATNFKQFGQAGVWLPKAGTIRTFVKNPRTADVFVGEPHRIDSIQLQNVSFEERDDISFALDYGNGTMIVDRSSTYARSSPQGEVVYIAPATLDELRNAAKSKRGWRWFIGLNIGLLLLLVVVMIIRRHRAQRAT